MRLWKKVSAMVAMAAVCMTMAVPVTASAAEVDARVGGCPGGCDTLQYGINKTILSSEPHIHDGGYICTIAEIQITYFCYCNDCGISYVQKQECYTEHFYDTDDTEYVNL